MSALERWLNPVHRSASGKGTLVLDDFFQSELVDQLVRFAEVHALWRRELGRYGAATTSAAEWAAAPDAERFFRFDKLDGARPESALADETITFLRLRKALGGPEFADYFSRMTGMAVEGDDESISLHRYRSGDFLRRHDDDDHGRSIAFVLYLSRGWEARFGGLFEMEGAAPLTPAFNRLLVFDVKAGLSHAVTEVSAAAPSSGRLSLGGWYREKGAKRGG